MWVRVYVSVCVVRVCCAYELEYTIILLVHTNCTIRCFALLVQYMTCIDHHSSKPNSLQLKIISKITAVVFYNLNVYIHIGRMRLRFNPLFVDLFLLFFFLSIKKYSLICIANETATHFVRVCVSRNPHRSPFSI